MKVFKNLILVSLSITLTLFIIEIIFRFLPQYNLQNYRMDEAMVHGDGVTEWLRPTQRFNYELIPNSRPWINSYGMYDKEYSLEKAEDTFRILVLGDSVTAGSSYAEMLEEKLNKQKGLRYDNIEIWNAALPAYALLDYELYWYSKGIKYKPDMLMIGFCINDFGPSSMVIYKTKDGFIEYWAPYHRAKAYFNRYLFHWSAFYRFLMLQIENLAFAKAPESHKGVLANIKQSTASHGIDLVAIILPFLKPLDAYNEDERQQYTEMVKTMKDLRIEFLDLCPLFGPNELRGFRQPDRPTDFTHPTKKGHKRYTEIIYDFLLSRGYLR